MAKASASDGRREGAGAQQSYFALFDLAPRFGIDVEQLDRAYRELAARVHPDRYVSLGPAELRQSLAAAITVNEAYRTLRTPILRARHLLDLRGAGAWETDAAMPPAFLLEQIEWREALADARAAPGTGALERLRAAVRDRAVALRAQLDLDLDANRDDAAAVLCVKKLSFVEKLLADLDDEFSLLEA